MGRHLAPGWQDDDGREPMRAHRPLLRLRAGGGGQDQGAGGVPAGWPNERWSILSHPDPDADRRPSGRLERPDHRWGPLDLCRIAHRQGGARANDQPVLRTRQNPLRDPGVEGRQNLDDEGKRRGATDSGRLSVTAPAPIAYGHDRDGQTGWTGRDRGRGQAGAGAGFAASAPEAHGALPESYK